MKKISALLFVLVITSCVGSKKAIENQPKQTENIAITKDILEETESDDREIYTLVEVVSEDGKTVVEVGSEYEAIEVLVNLEKNKTTNDSLINYNRGYFTPSNSKWNELLEKHVTNQGNVNYLGFNQDLKILRAYINTLIKNMPNDKWSKKEKLAYWINAYNALTIDLILRNYPTKSIKDIKDPWDQRLWKFGDKWQNLNDIEHEILRNMNEPRIHFAIVCASVSCPKLQNEAFTASNLEEQLTKATKEFLTDTSKNELSKDKIKLSKIFKWFKKDFEQNGSLIDFLNTYSDILVSEKAKKSFMDYNWNLND